jgi:UDP-arabinose 4-epimerase
MTDAVIVTGGAGYIGSHVCKALAMAGYIPITIDNLSEGHFDLVKWGPFEQVDILDRAKVHAIFLKYSIDAVVHLAASAYIEESFQKPAKYYKNNVEGTLSILQVCREYGCKRLVFSSSCATYGIPASVPISESHDCYPISPYGRSKLTAENMIRDFADAYDLSYCCLRFFNAAGGDPERETGEDHDPEPHLIPRVFLVAMGDIPSFQINGDDFPTPDGSAIRDFIHTADLASAHLSALKHLERGGGSEILNIGTGQGVSVKEVVSMIEQVTGRVIPVSVVARRLGDPPVLVADPSRAQSTIGFKPVHSGLENILETAWNWHCFRRGFRN